MILYVYDLAHVAGPRPYSSRDLLLLSHMFSGMDLFYAHPGQPLAAASEELEDLQIYIMIYL